MITILGAGVVGLTTALELARRWQRVRVLAEHFSPHTTSDGAAALWEPAFSVPSDLTRRMAFDTYAQLRTLAGVPASGVFALRHHSAHPPGKELPWWLAGVPHRVGRVTFPSGQQTDGYDYSSWIADMSVFMPWLMAQCAAHGITFHTRKITQLEELADTGPVVACGGAGMAALTMDAALVPTRGIVLIYDGKMYEDSFSPALAVPEVSYLLPRRTQTVVGGTYEPGVPDVHPPADIVARLRARAEEYFPALRGREPLKIWAGLRPARAQPRLERDGARPWLWHHYGHGGAGLTYSFGSAGIFAERFARFS